MNSNLGGWEGEKREGDECFSEALPKSQIITITMAMAIAMEITSRLVMSCRFYEANIMAVDLSMVAVGSYVCKMNIQILPNPTKMSSKIYQNIKHLYGHCIGVNVET